MRIATLAIAAISALAASLWTPAFAQTGSALEALKARDYARAYQLAQQDVTAPDNGAALYVMSIIYDGGFGQVRIDKARALALLQQAVQKQFPDALVVLGMRHLDGDGVERDVAEAKRLWLLAENLGDEEVAYNLAVMFHRIERDYARAVPYLRRAIVQGNRDAMMDMAELYRKGQGVEKNLAETHALWRRAAFAGEVGAFANLVEAHVNGEGLAADMVRAQMWVIIGDKAHGYVISPEGRNIINRALTADQKQEAARLAGLCEANPETAC